MEDYQEKQRAWDELEASVGLGVPQQDPQQGAQIGREEEEASGEVAEKKKKHAGK